MVVPALASAQEQGSTDTDSELTDEVTAADETTTTEDPATETPPADPPAEPVEPVEPTVPAPEPEQDAPDSGGFEGSTDTSKAPAESATSSDAASAPAPAPKPEPAEVAAVEAEATDSPGNDDGGSDATAGRAVARGGGELEATKASSESKPGCLARGGAGEIHNTFPDDGSCDQSLFEEGGTPLPTTADGISDLDLTLNGVTVTLDIWSTDEGDTVNVKVLTGGPVALDVYVKGGQPHTLCSDNNVAIGETVVCSPVGGGFSHLDVCVREETPEEVPPPPLVINPPRDDERTPPEDEVLTQEEREQREEQREELEEAVPPTVVPTAVTPAPEDALPFTGLDTGWLVLMSLGLLGTGVLLRRKVS